MVQTAFPSNNGHFTSRTGCRPSILLSLRYYPFAIIPRVIKIKRLNALNVRGKRGGA